MARPTKDPLLFCRVLGITENTQRLIWMSKNQCYNNNPVYECSLSEEEAGYSVVDSLLKGGKGHWSPLEHNKLVMSVAYAPHDLVAQITRHRLMSFSVQSFRYTTIDASSLNDIDKLVYLRQPGVYKDRRGASYSYTDEKRAADIRRAKQAVQGYLNDIGVGFSPEHARGLLPYNLRQHFVISGNLRAWLHVLDLRLKADAQPEIQQFSQQTQVILNSWCPQILDWYNTHRANKALLSP